MRVEYKFIAYIDTLVLENYLKIFVKITTCSYIYQESLE